jgi:hypothetical protein
MTLKRLSTGAAFLLPRCQTAFCEGTITATVLAVSYNSTGSLLTMTLDTGGSVTVQDANANDFRLAMALNGY